MQLEKLLDELYKSEINVQINWCWDAGIRVSIGNAFCCGMSDTPDASTYVREASQIAPWLALNAIKLYPDSAFAKLMNSTDEAKCDKIMKLSKLLKDAEHALTTYQGLYATDLPNAWRTSLDIELFELRDEKLLSDIGAVLE
jgi:hypothetical protein